MSTEKEIAGFDTLERSRLYQFWGFVPIPIKAGKKSPFGAKWNETTHSSAILRAKKALETAFRKQIDGVGLSLVEFLSACPSNWHLNPTECLEFIEERILREYPLGEFKNVDSIDYSVR